MREKLTINGKDYKPAEMTFNNVCRMEELGVPLEVMDERGLSVLRAYFALCGGFTRATAGAEIEKHIIAGGNLEELADCLGEACEESGFFRALTKSPENSGEAKEESIKV